jgi:hypothetical protein
LFSASAALQEIREATGLSWFSPKENHTSRTLSGHGNCETL